MITGDKHYNAVRNIPPDEVSFAADPIATEFIGGSITSGGHFAGPGPAPTADNPHHLWRDRRHGYVRVDLDPTTWRADYRLVADVRDVNSPSRFEGSWTVANGDPGAVPVAVPAV